MLVRIGLAKKLQRIKIFGIIDNFKLKIITSQELNARYNWFLVNTEFSHSEILNKLVSEIQQNCHYHGILCNERKAIYNKMIREIDTFPTKLKSYSRSLAENNVINKIMGKTSRFYGSKEFNSNYFKFKKQMMFHLEKQDFRKISKEDWNKYSELVGFPDKVRKDKSSDYCELLQKRQNYWSESKRKHKQDLVDEKVQFESEDEEEFDEDTDIFTLASAKQSKKIKGNLDRFIQQTVRFNLPTRQAEIYMNTLLDGFGIDFSMGHRQIYNRQLQYKKSADYDTLRKLGLSNKFIIGIDGKDHHEVLTIRALWSERSEILSIPGELLYFAPDKRKRMANRMSTAINEWIDITNNNIQEQWGSFNFKYENIVSFVYDTTSLNSGTTSGIAVQLQNLIGEQSYRSTTCMCAFHSHELRFKHVFNSISFKVFDNWHRKKKLPSYKVPGMTEGTNKNLENLDLNIFLFNYNHLIRTDTEIIENMKKSNLRMELDENLTPSKKVYKGTDNIRKKLSRFCGISNQYRINQIALLTENISVRWSSKAVNFLHYMLAREFLIPFLKGKIYTDASSESLRQYILHVDRILTEDKKLSFYPMHDLIITYFDSLMGLLGTKDIVYETFLITSNFAKLCLRHDLGNEQILKNLNTHTYLADAHFAVLTMNDEILELLQKEIPASFKTNKMIEYAKKTLVDNRYGKNDKKFQLKDWAQLSWDTIIDNHYRLRALHSPLNFHLEEIGREKLTKLLVFENSMAERLVNELKMENKRSKPKLVKLTDDLVIDDRISSIRARIAGREEMPYDSNKNVIKPAKKRSRGI